jgi:hypothetical protein
LFLVFQNSYKFLSSPMGSLSPFLIGTPELNPMVSVLHINPKVCVNYPVNFLFFLLESNNRLNQYKRRHQKHRQQDVRSGVKGVFNLYCALPVQFCIYLKYPLMQIDLLGLLLNTFWICLDSFRKQVPYIVK